MEIGKHMKAVRDEAQVTHMRNPYKDRSVTHGGFAAFPDTSLSAGSTATVSLMVQVPFRVKRLVIDPACAEGLIVTDLKVGRNSIFFNGNGAPATAFPPLPTNIDDLELLRELESMLKLYSMDVIQISQLFSIGLANATKEPKVFRGLVWGEAVSPEKTR